MVVELGAGGLMSVGTPAQIRQSKREFEQRRRARRRRRKTTPTPAVQTVQVVGSTVLIDGKGFSVAPEQQAAFIQQQTGGRGASAQAAIERAKRTSEFAEQQRVQRAVQKRISTAKAEGIEGIIARRRLEGQAMSVREEPVAGFRPQPRFGMGRQLERKPVIVQLEEGLSTVTKPITKPFDLAARDVLDVLGKGASLATGAKTLKQTEQQVSRTSRILEAKGVPKIFTKPPEFIGLAGVEAARFTRERPSTVAGFVGLGFVGGQVFTGVAALGKAGLVATKAASIGLSTAFVGTKAFELVKAEGLKGRAGVAGRTLVEVSAFTLGAALVKKPTITKDELAKAAATPERFGGRVTKKADFLRVDVVGTRTKGDVSIISARKFNIFGPRVTKGRITTKVFKKGVLVSKAAQTFTGKDLKVTGLRQAQVQTLRNFAGKPISQTTVTKELSPEGFAGALIDFRPTKVQAIPTKIQTVGVGRGKFTKENLITFATFKPVVSGRGTIRLQRLAGAGKLKIVQPQKFTFDIGKKAQLDLGLISKTRPSLIKPSEFQTLPGTIGATQRVTFQPVTPSRLTLFPTFQTTTRVQARTVTPRVGQSLAQGPRSLQRLQQRSLTRQTSELSSKLKSGQQQQQQQQIARIVQPPTELAFQPIATFPSIPGLVSTQLGKTKRFDLPEFETPRRKKKKVKKKKGRRRTDLEIQTFTERVIKGDITGKLLRKRLKRSIA